MTESQRRIIVRQYRARVPLKVIAHKVGVSPQRVSVIAIAEGCPSRKRAWADVIGATGNSGLPAIIRRRVKRGWDVQAAMTTPPRSYARHADA
jgi:hypothetical protein